MPSALAMPQANSGPLPPKANSANSRGSRPRSVDTALMARIMFDAAIWCAPYAACSSVMPSGSAIFSVKALPRLASAFQLQRAADEVRGVDVAEQHIGVR